MGMAEWLIVLSMWAIQVEGDIEIPEIEMPPTQQRGLASWYGSEDGTNDNGMHGEITATGESFIPADQTCASRRIPLGTYVLVEIVETGKRAFCRVNDRGPYGAVLDGEWVAMWHRRGEWVVRRRNGEGGWYPEESFSTRPPARYRGVMDLSRGTAEALDFDFRAGLNEVRIRYFPVESGRFHLSMLD